MFNSPLTLAEFVTIDKTFYNLHCHSDYSQFDSVAKYSDMVARAKELGQDALGVTEHGTTSGLLDFYLKCKGAGIKPILGCEFYIVPSYDEKHKDRKLNRHIILYAKDVTGYRNLNKLNEIAHKHTYYDPRITLDVLRDYAEGLVCTSACIGGLLGTQEAEFYAKDLKKIFGGDFYIEIHTNTTVHQKKYNYKVADIAKRFGIPLTIAVDSHYVYESDAAYHRQWIGISDNSEYYQTDEHFIMGYDDAIPRLRYMSENVVNSALAGMREIVSKCNVEILKEERNYPVFTNDDEDLFLRDLIHQGWRQKVINHPVRKHRIEEYRERLLMEFDVLKKCGYVNYFLIVADMCKHADENGIRRGVGRGSVNGCLIAFLLNITKIDPIECGLVFERFVSLERVTPPDIDIDFCSTRRKEIIAYLSERWGYVYHIRTFNLVGAKAGLQRAAQSLGIHHSLATRLSKSIKSDLSELPEKSPISEIKQSEYESLVNLAAKFVGLIESFGCHASAVMVFPSDPCQWCSIEKQRDDYVVNYDFHLLEGHFGLLKFDILGLATLSVIDECLRLVGDRMKYDIDNLPYDDPATFKMLCAGDTKGCFQIESEGMTQLVIALQPKSFYDIIPLVALYRPGTLDAGMVDVFVERKNGKPFRYEHPKLEPILRDTQGVILYQEQIQQIARVLCGYTLGEGDVLRRIIGRKEASKMQSAIDMFINRGVENGISRDIITGIAEKIVTFANYGFNKGHSAAYGMVSYQTAYLMANFPLEYFTALLNNQLGVKEKTATYFYEAKRRGFNLLPPTIEKSKMRWSIEGNAIRCGFSAIMNVGTNYIPNGDCEFEKYFFENPNINKRAYESLIKVGCFSGLREFDLAMLPQYKEVAKRVNQCKEKIALFKDAGNEKKVMEWSERLHQAFASVDTSKVEEFDYAFAERSLLGFLFDEPLLNYDFSFAERVPNVIAGEVVEIKPFVTKFGKPYARVNVRFFDKIYNLVFFSERYTQLLLYEVYFFKVKEDSIIKDFCLVDSLV